MINTVVAVFIKDKKILMEKRPETKRAYANFLMCPAGLIKENESFIETLKREMKEELHVDVTTAKHLFTIYDKDPLSKLEFKNNFMLIESYNGKIEKTEEAKNLVWLSYGELKKIELASITDKLIEKLHEKKLI